VPRTATALCVAPHAVRRGKRRMHRSARCAASRPASKSVDKRPASMSVDRLPSCCCPSPPVACVARAMKRPCLFSIVAARCRANGSALSGSRRACAHCSSLERSWQGGRVGARNQYCLCACMALSAVSRRRPRPPSPPPPPRPAKTLPRCWPTPLASMMISVSLPSLVPRRLRTPPKVAALRHHRDMQQNVLGSTASRRTGCDMGVVFFRIATEKTESCGPRISLLMLRGSRLQLFLSHCSSPSLHYSTSCHRCLAHH